MKKRLLALTAIVALVAASPAYPFGLWHAFEQALRHDLHHRQREATLRANFHELPLARAALLPEAELELVRAWRSDRLDRPGLDNEMANDDGAIRTERTSGVGTAEPGRPPASALDTSPRDRYPYSRASLNLRQSLFDGAKLAALAEARSQEAEAALRIDQLRQELLLRVARAYFDVLAGLDTVHITSLERQTIRDHWLLTRRRFEEKIGPLTDVHESRSRYHLARAELAGAREDLQSAIHEFRKLTGIDDLDLDRLPAVFEPLPIAPADVTNRPAGNYAVHAVRIAAQDLATAEIEVERQRRRRWPTIGLNASTSYEEDRIDDAVSAYERRRHEILLHLTVPIFSAQANRATIRQALERRNAAAFALANARAERERDMRTAHSALKASVERMQAFRLVYEDSEKAYRLREQGYREGLGTNLQLIDALRDTYRARRQWLVSRYEHLMAYLRLEETRHDISESAVRRIDRRLTPVTAGQCLLYVPESDCPCRTPACR